VAGGERSRPDEALDAGHGDQLEQRGQHQRREEELHRLGQPARDGADARAEREQDWEDRDPGRQERLSATRGEFAGHHQVCDAALHRLAALDREALAPPVDAREVGGVEPPVALGGAGELVG